MCQRTTRRPWFAATAALVTLLAAAGALAQQGSRVMVQEDETGRHVLHMSMPDVATLAEPDYRRSDLPVFEEKLGLDATQRVLVRELLEVYLEGFRSLRAEMAAAFREGPLRMHVGALEDDDDAGGDGDGAFVRIGGGPGEGVDALVGAAVKELRGPGAAGGPGEMAVMVSVDAGGGGGIELPEGDEGGVVVSGGDGAAGEPQVMLALSGDAAENLSDEARAKLEEMAAKIAEQMREQMAAGEGPLGGAGGLRAEPMSIEEHREAIDALNESVAELRKAKDELARSFVTDVQLQLTEAQLDRWPALERALTRIKTLPKGRLDGERTDVLALLEELQLGEDELQAIEEDIEAFELALHQALVARNAAVVDAGQRVDKALEAERYDRALNIIERVANLRVAVRRLNEQFTETVCGQLPPPRASELRQRFDAVSYPSVYRETFGDRVFAAVNALPDLDVAMTRTVQELEASYRAERERVDAEIVRTIRREQPDEPKRPIERMKAASGEPVLTPLEDVLDPTGDDVRSAFERRRELDRKYAKLIEAMLTPEQRQLLPQPPTVRRGPIIIGG